MPSENWGGSRPGSGRPQKLKNAHFRGFDCPDELWEELGLEAEIRGKKRADFIRDLLKKGLTIVENVAISADSIDIKQGYHKNVVQDGNTVSFKAKDQGKFGPMGIWYYLLPDNSIIEHSDPGRLPGLQSSIRTYLGYSWKDLQKLNSAKPNEWQKDPDGREWGILGLSYEKK